MFPSLDLDAVATTITEEATTTSTTIGRVVIIDFSNTDGKATVKIENGKPVEATTTAEKVQAYVKLLLRTTLDKYKVYTDTDFGMTYFKYLGRRDLPLGFIQSEIKREIVEKVEKLDVVDNVSDFLTSMSGTTLTVNFTINLVDATSTTIEETVVA